MTESTQDKTLAPSLESWFINRPNAFENISQDFYTEGYQGVGIFDEDRERASAFDLMLRRKRDREIQAGYLIPSKDEAGRLSYQYDFSTKSEKAAAGFERQMERMTSSGWGEKASQPVREDFRRLTTGKVIDFDKASTVESLDWQGVQDWWNSLVDAMPFTDKSTAESEQLLNSFLSTVDNSYSNADRLKDLRQLVDRNPEIETFARNYGIDLQQIALNARNRLSMPFMVESAIQDALITKRYEKYETEASLFQKFRWNAGEMIQDPSLLRDIVITTAATAGLGTIELAAARLGTAGISAGTRVAQLSSKLLQAAGPMVGFVEGPAFLALRAVAPRIGTVGARLGAIALEGGVAGTAVTLRSQYEDYARRELLFNDLNGKPFNPNYAEAALAGVYASALSATVLIGMRSVLGSVGDIAAARAVKKAGGTYGDMARAYGREWTNSLDTWARTSDGLTVWGNNLSNGRGIYFGDWLDRTIKRSGIDNRNFTNVLAGGSRVWGRVDPIMAARLNLDMAEVGRVVDKFEEITGVAGEAAMRGAAGAEVADAFSVLTHGDNLKRLDLSADEIVRALDELKLKIDGAAGPVGPSGRLIGEVKDRSYVGLATAAKRVVSLLSIDKYLGAREVRLSDVHANAEKVTGRTLDIQNDGDYADIITAANYAIGTVNDSRTRQIAEFAIRYDAQRFGDSVLLTDEEKAGIRENLLNTMSDKDEFIIADGTSAVKVNKKTGTVEALPRSLEVDSSGRLVVNVDRDGTKIAINKLEGEDVISTEKVAMDVNSAYEKVKKLFDEKYSAKIAEVVRKNNKTAKPEDIEKILKDLFNKKKEPTPGTLARAFGLDRRQANAAYLVMRAMGYDPETSLLRIARGVAGRDGLEAGERAKIFFFDMDGATASLIRAVKGDADLGTAIHELGHFSSIMTFGRGAYSPDALRRIGISEELEKRFFDWVGVKTVDDAGNPLTRDQIADQFEGSAVQERLANAWNVYMRNILTNKSYKGNTAVHMLLNKIGDLVGNLGERMKSAEAFEADLEKRTGKVVGSAAEEVFDALVARSEANIMELYTFAYNKFFRDLDPDVREDLGVQILGEARFNDWKAEQQKKVNTSVREIKPVIEASGAKLLDAAEIRLRLSEAISRDLNSKTVKTVIERVSAKNPRLDGEDDAAYSARLRQLILSRVEEYNSLVEMIKEKVKSGEVTSFNPLAMAFTTLVPATPGRMRAIASDELQRIVDSLGVTREGDEAPLFLRTTGIGKIEVDVAGAIYPFDKGFIITKEMAKAELDRRTAAAKRKKTTPAEAKTKIETSSKTEVTDDGVKIPAGTEVTADEAGLIREAAVLSLEDLAKEDPELAKLVSELKTEREAEAKAKLEELARDDAEIAKLVEQLRVERGLVVESDVDIPADKVTVAEKVEDHVEAAEAEAEAMPEREIVVVEKDAKDGNTLIVTDKNGVVQENLSTTEKTAAVANQVGVDSLNTEQARTGEIASAASVKEAVKAANKPPEPVTVRNTVDAEAVPVRTETVTELQRKAKQAKENMPVEQAEVLEELVAQADLSTEDNAKALIALLEEQGINDKDAILAEIKSRLAQANSTINKIEEAVSGIGLDASFIRQRFNITDADANLFYDVFTIIKKLQDGNDIDLQKAADDLRNSPSEEAANTLYEVMRRKKLATEAAKGKLLAFAKVADIERAVSALHSYRNSVDFVTNPNNVARYAEAQAAETKKPQQKAIITQYEGHMARVQAGSLDRVPDVTEVQKKSHYKTDAAEAKDEAILSSLTQREKQEEAIREVIADNEQMILSTGLNPEQAMHLVRELLTPFTNKVVDDYKLGMIGYYYFRNNQPELAKKFVSATSAEINAEFTKITGQLAALKDKTPEDTWLRYGLQIVQSRAVIPVEFIPNLMNSVFFNLKNAFEKETRIVQLFENPKVTKLATGNLDRLRFARVVFDKIDNDDIMTRLMRQDMADIEAQIDLQRRKIAANKRGEETKTRLVNELNEMLRTQVLYATLKDYRRAVNANMNKSGLLPDAFYREIRGIARRMKDTEGRATASAERGILSIEGDEDIGKSAIQVENNGRSFAATASVINGLNDIYQLMAIDLKKDVSAYLPDLSKANRERLIDVMDAMRSVVDSEVGTKQNPGRYYARVSEVLKERGLKPIGQDAFETATERIATLVESVYEALAPENPELAGLMLSTRGGTIRVGQAKSIADWKKRVNKFLEVSEPDADGKVTATISFPQASSLADAVYNAYKQVEGRGKVDLGNDNLDMTLHQIDNQLGKDIFTGKVKNAYEAAVRIRDTTKREDLRALLDNLIQLRKSDLKNTPIMAGINKGQPTQAASYHPDYNFLVVNNLGKIDLLEETLAHELVHAVSSRYITKIMDEFDIIDTMGPNAYIESLQRAKLQATEKMGDLDINTAAGQLEHTRLQLFIDTVELYNNHIEVLASRYNMPVDRIVTQFTVPDMYSGFNIHEMFAVMLTDQPSARASRGSLAPVELEEAIMGIDQPLLEYVARLNEVVVGSEDAAVLAEIHMANTLLGIAAIEGREAADPVPMRQYTPSSINDPMAFRYDPGTKTVVPSSQMKKAAIKSFAQLMDLTEDQVVREELEGNRIINEIKQGKIVNGKQLAEQLIERTQLNELRWLLTDVLAVREGDLQKTKVVVNSKLDWEGEYRPEDNTLVLNQGFDPTVLIAHELIHAVSTRLFWAIQKKFTGSENPNFDAVVKMAAELESDETATQKIAEVVGAENANETRKALKDAYQGYLDTVQALQKKYGVDTKDIARADEVWDNLYVGYDINEFFAEGLTGPTFVRGFAGEGEEAFLNNILQKAEEVRRDVLPNLMSGLVASRAKILTSMRIASTFGRVIRAESNMLKLQQSTVKSFAQAIASADIEAKARSDYKAAKGRLNTFLREYPQKRAEFELRARIETEGMAGKDVSGLERRLEDLILSADERQRTLRSMGLNEEIEPQDFAVLTNMINGNDAFFTADVSRSIATMRRITEATQPAERVSRPTNVREMTNEERNLYLLDTVLPRIVNTLGRRNTTAGVFSLLTDSPVGRRAFNQLIGKSVEYANVADSPSVFLQFVAKFFDPMMDLRDGELSGMFNMPSVDRLNAEVFGLYQKSGMTEAIEAVRRASSSQDDMDYINAMAWRYLATPGDVPADARFRNVILQVIEATNKLNAEAHETLKRYGGLRGDADALEYGTVRKAGHKAYQDPKGFADALYEHMLRTEYDHFDKGRISALAAEGLGWLDMKRHDTTEDIQYVTLTENSPLLKLFPDSEVGSRIEWRQARKILESGRESLSADEQATLRNALSSTDDYKDSYKRLHPQRDNTYSVIRQAAEIAANRYMGLGEVGDAKTIKPRSEMGGGGYNYAEERIMTHSELASNPQLSQYFDQNIVELTEHMLRTQLVDAATTRMFSEFFGNDVRVSFLDLLEIFRQVGEEQSGNSTLSIKERQAINTGYERAKAAWEDFTGKLPTAKDSMDSWLATALVSSRIPVLTVGGIRAFTSSGPELARAIVASDHNKPKLMQIVSGLMKAVKYGMPITGAAKRERLFEAATAYQWIRSMSMDTILARSDMIPDNPFHSVSFGGRKGFVKQWAAQWRGVRETNRVETSNFKKFLNYVGVGVATPLGTPLAWINLVTTAIHVDNAQRNLTKNYNNFAKLVDALEAGRPTNMDAFEKLANSCGLSGKEALDLSTSGVLRKEVVTILKDMASDPSTKTDGLLDMRKMFAWARTQTKHDVNAVDDAINSLSTYVNMTIRHTNAEPTLLDKRVAVSPYAHASNVFMQFLLSHSIQEIGRRRRYSTVDYGKHIVGLMLMEAGVYGMSKHIWSSDKEKERSTTEDIIRTATSMPVFGTYQFLATLIRQVMFQIYNGLTDEEHFTERVRVPGLMDSPAANTPRRAMNGAAWSAGILKDLLQGL